MKDVFFKVTKKSDNVSNDIFFFFSIDLRKKLFKLKETENGKWSVQYIAKVSIWKWNKETVILD